MIIIFISGLDIDCPFRVKVYVKWCNNATINFQGSRFSTKDFKDNNGHVFVKKNLLTWECWVQSVKSEHQCVCFYNPTWAIPVCTCMLWKTMIALNGRWGAVLSKAFKNFKQWEVLSILISTIQCALCICCMFWKTKSFTLHHWWGALLLGAFENFKWQKVLNMLISSDFYELSYVWHQF